MTERERLTTERRKIFARENLTLMSMTKEELRQHYNEIFDRLQEYEVAEENNQIIVPPCKVGDTVYSYCKEFGTVLAYFVEQITILYDTDNKRGLWVYEANCVETGDLIDCIDFYSEDIGKTVFLTRREAEKAMKGGATND